MSKKKIEFNGLEVRLYDNGHVDEVVTKDVGGKVDFHMEQMSESAFWMRFYSTPYQPMPKDVVVNMRIETDNKFGTRLVARVELDSAADYHRAGNPPPAPDLDVHKQVDQLIKTVGMKRILESLIKNVQEAHAGELADGKSENHIDYLTRLQQDLRGTLQTYERRHEFEQEDTLDALDG